MAKALFWILFGYVLYSSYIIKGYDRMNDSLLRANDTLLRACSNSKLHSVDLNEYK